MKWSFKLGRFLGIDVFVHFTFMVLLCFIGIAHWVAGQSFAAAFSGVLFFGCLFACVLLHEYGHALMARYFGIGTKDITLLPIGGVARLERIPDKPSQELWVALAGPAVNVVIVGLLCIWLSLTSAWQPLNSLGITEGNLVERLLVANVFLVLFNMLPAFPMDGGRVLRALLAMRLEYSRATQIAANLGKGMAIVLAVFGLVSNPLLILIAVFVWIGASQEAMAAQFKSAVAGALVREAALTNFTTVPSTASLRDLTSILLSESQQDFPVVENGRVVGILVHAEILAAIQSRPAETPVSAIMRTEFDTAEENSPLDELLTHLRYEGGCAIPVMGQGNLVGLLTAENLNEYSIIRAATRSSSQPPPLPIVRHSLSL
ncbi:MAG: site-2 protease family protein [Gloeobacteraceae cyanobacterium ES-bin-144]|nr:site-2 protease family protein [Verrucomicrobiales bacterium]